MGPHRPVPAWPHRQQREEPVELFLVQAAAMKSTWLCACLFFGLFACFCFGLAHIFVAVNTNTRTFLFLGHPLSFRLPGLQLNQAVGRRAGGENGKAPSPHEAVLALFLARFGVGGGGCGATHTRILGALHPVLCVVP